MGLPKSFLFIQTPAAPNLCVEFIMWKFNAARRTETVSIRTVTDNTLGTRRAFDYKWTTAQSTAPSTGTSAAKMGLVLGSGNFVPTEKGCRSSNNTILSIGASTFPQAGKNMDITLAGGLPNSSAFLAVGLSDSQGFGGTLPLAGSLFGAPGCFIWNQDLFLVPATVGSTGNTRLRFLMPSGVGYTRVYVHWWNMDRNANALGWTTSNYGKILLGN